MILQLTRAFNTLNEDLFDGCLSRINFKTSLGRKCIFHFIAPETIEIGTSILDANKKDIFEDLVHVMVHMYNFQKGISDHTLNQYHNRHFVERALSVGLIVVHHKARGWGITVFDTNQIDASSPVRFPEPDASDHLAKCCQKISWSDLEFENFKSAMTKSVRSKPQKEYLLKYVCGKCDPPVIIRSGRRPDGQKPIDITCNHCGANFVLDERLY